MNRPTITYEGYQPDLLGALGTHDYTVRIRGKSVRIQIKGPPDKLPEEAEIDAHMKTRQLHENHS